MRLALLLLASGCTQLLGVHDFEASPDASARTCRGARWRWCTSDPLPPPRTLADTLDTDDPTCADTLEDGTSACVIASSAVFVSTLRVHGARPLVLVGDTVTIGMLDVSSREKLIGPAADPDACEPATPGWNEDRTHLAGSGGGAGGSFGTPGGRGGDPSAAAFSTVQLGGGVPAAAMNLRGLYGGCPGSAGGVAKSQAQATAGHGGGAVLIIASTLELDGAIDAGGSGGGGGDAAAGSFNAYLSGGGGGGGAGGLVALEIAALTGVGSVAANGGGGGGGGQVKAVGPGFTAGQPGEDSAPSGNVCALGGAGGTSGGAGGCGTFPARDGVGNGNLDALNYGSGGGGGGAVGIILSTVPIANASPPAEMM